MLLNLWNRDQEFFSINAAIITYLELTLLKGRQRFDAISTSNLEVYKFWDWWILSCINFGIGESSPNLLLNMLNLYLVKFEAWWILNERAFFFVLFFVYYFVYLKVNLDLENIIQLGESSPNFIFAAVNLDPVVIEKGWTEVNLNLTFLLKRWTEVKTWGG